MSSVDVGKPVADAKQGTAPRLPFVTAILLSAGIVGCALYGKWSSDPAGANFLIAHNGEYYRIAESLCAGEGFANPMADKTGPTAWCAPVYSMLFATLLWLGNGDRDVVVVAVMILQVGVLIATGVLILGLTWQTTRHIGPLLAAAVFLGALVDRFMNWFQVSQDCWLVLLMFDLMIAGLVWCNPLANGPRAASWGIFGGLCAMVNPSIGLPWGVLTLAHGYRSSGWSRTGVALFAVVLALTPWTVRNYLVFGRLIPVKSNLAYELYQSQCMQDDGLFHATTARRHPSVRGSREGQEYKALGETAYLDRKREQFADAVWADPMDFLDRVADRFLAATVWYVPFNRVDEARRPAMLWARRLVHPLPFLALGCLLCSGFRAPLSWPQWSVIGIYMFYLMPYVAASYYPRYAIPLVAVKVLLVIWALDRLWSLRSASRTMEERVCQ
jgi:hypothetical protein